MGQKIIIVVGVGVLVILALFMFNGPGSQSVSPNILYITQPVNTLSGKVEKIEGNVVLISSQYSLPQTAAVMVKVEPGQPLVLPTPQTKTITYRLLVTDKTQINQPATFVNYLLKTVTPAPQAKLVIKDIKVGQYVSVNSPVDLRTLANDTFEATMINLPPIANTLNGKIVSVTNNTLILKAFAPVTGGPMGFPGNTVAGAAPQEKEYQINITSDTEISRSTPPKPEKLSVSDLKKDMQATVYTAEDVIESQTLTALRIEPAQVMPSVVPLTPIPTATPTPTASPLPTTEP